MFHKHMSSLQKQMLNFVNVFYLFIKFLEFITRYLALYVDFSFTLLT